VVSALLALGVTVITACLDEWHQTFDPSRTGSIRDIGLDTLGGIIFLSFTLLIFKIWREAPKRPMETASV
jgi:VanZ family protein